MTVWLCVQRYYIFHPIWSASTWNGNAIKFVCPIIWDFYCPYQCDTFSKYGSIFCPIFESVWSCSTNLSWETEGSTIALKWTCITTLISDGCAGNTEREGYNYDVTIWDVIYLTIWLNGQFQTAQSRLFNCTNPCIFAKNLNSWTFAQILYTWQMYWV